MLPAECTERTRSSHAIRAPRRSARSLCGHGPIQGARRGRSSGARGDGQARCESAGLSLGSLPFPPGHDELLERRLRITWGLRRHVPRGGIDRATDRAGRAREGWRPRAAATRRAQRVRPRPAPGGPPRQRAMAERPEDAARSNARGDLCGAPSMGVRRDPRRADEDGGEPDDGERFVRGDRRRRGAPMERVLRTFVEQAGAPVVSVSLACKADEAPRVELELARLAVAGAPPDASLWPIPRCALRTFRPQGGEAGLVAEHQRQVSAACPVLVGPGSTRKRDRRRGRHRQSRARRARFSVRPSLVERALARVITFPWRKLDDHDERTLVHAGD